MASECERVVGIVVSVGRGAGVEQGLAGSEIEGWTGNWKSRMVMCVRCAMYCVPVPCYSQLCNGRARASGFGAGGEEVNDVFGQMDIE
jgi:hypothetical protein